MEDMKRQAALEQILTLVGGAEGVLTALMPELVRLFECDRCFLYLRDPETGLGCVPFCWCLDETIPDVTSNQLEAEPEDLARIDPMFAAALRGDDHIFIDDVETASAAIVNRDFEQEQFGHRALVHAHLYRDGLWGILQPSVFGRPRHWEPEERKAIAQIVTRITPLAIAYVGENFRSGAEK